MEHIQNTEQCLPSHSRPTCLNSTTAAPTAGPAAGGDDSATTMALAGLVGGGGALLGAYACAVSCRRWRSARPASGVGDSFMEMSVSGGTEQSPGSLREKLLQ